MQKLNFRALSAELTYSPLTGHFHWHKRKNGCRKSQRAGYIGVDGYCTIRINGTLYKAHRLAWFYVHKRWPSKFIDHVNGDRGDNRLENLREAEHSDNIQNSKLSKLNKSGYKGVSFHKRRRKWRARIRARGEVFELGFF